MLFCGLLHLAHFGGDLLCSHVPALFLVGGVFVFVLFGVVGCCWMLWVVLRVAAFFVSLVMGGVACCCWCIVVAGMWEKADGGILPFIRAVAKKYRAAVPMFGVFRLFQFTSVGFGWRRYM